jgi:anti-anti-sigma regulatory factor
MIENHGGKPTLKAGLDWVNNLLRRLELANSQAVVFSKWLPTDENATDQKRWQCWIERYIPNVVSLTGFKVTEETFGVDRVVRFFGNADLLSLPMLQTLFQGLEHEVFRALLVDLSATQFINSPVWAVITLFSRKKNRVKIMIVGLPDPIQGSFEMMGLDQVFTSFRSIEEAQAALDREGKE